MKNILSVLPIIALVLVFGCSQAKDFNYGVKQINEINDKYNTTMDTYPKHLKQIENMGNELRALKSLNLDKGQEPLNYLVDYRLLNLEVERLYILGQKYGDSGTTKYGFGCKSRPLVIESVAYRNSSALKGFEAIDLLRKFVDKYPKEANSAGFSYKNALFLNATFYQISSEAIADGNIINYFCPANETLELYKKEFKKETNLSDEFISSLTYEQAVPIWKKLSELN